MHTVHLVPDHSHFFFLLFWINTYKKYQKGETHVHVYKAQLTKSKLVSSKKKKKERKKEKNRKRESNQSRKIKHQLKLAALQLLQNSLNPYCAKCFKKCIWGPPLNIFTPLYYPKQRPDQEKKNSLTELGISLPMPPQYTKEGTISITFHYIVTSPNICGLKRWRNLKLWELCQAHGMACCVWNGNSEGTIRSQIFCREAAV